MEQKNQPEQETEYVPAKRRSFYVEDELWYPLQSKLWAKKSNASRWIREQIEEYLYKNR